MKNIRFVLLGELVLLILMLVLCIGSNFQAYLWFLDLPSIIIIVLFLILGLLIMGEWKDFIRSFSVGIKAYSLLDLKNIIGAVDAAQKLTIYGALFAIITSGVMIMGSLDDLGSLGPKLAVCFLAGFYAIILEFFFLPLKLNAERKMNEEMDFEEMDFEEKTGSADEHI